jgi:hypothetical protein
MSSKILQIYYLTEYTLGRIIKAWPRSRYRATNANAVSTLGFHDREMTKNPRFAQSASRPIGTLPARAAKRQSGAKTGLYACMNTMTVIDSSEIKTNIVTVCARFIRGTDASFWGFTWGKNPFSGVVKTWIKSVRQQKGPPLEEAGLSFIKTSVSHRKLGSQLANVCAPISLVIKPIMFSMASGVSKLCNEPSTFASVGS